MATGAVTIVSELTQRNLVTEVVFEGRKPAAGAVRVVGKVAVFILREGGVPGMGSEGCRKFRGAEKGGGGTKGREGGGKSEGVGGRKSGELGGFGNG